jgi:hypothetical protein
MARNSFPPVGHYKVPRRIGLERFHSKVKSVGQILVVIVKKAEVWGSDFSPSGQQRQRERTFGDLHEFNGLSAEPRDNISVIVTAIDDNEHKELLRI